MKSFYVTPKRIDKAIDFLVGTTNTVHEAIDMLFSNKTSVSSLLNAKLKEHIFRCEVCNYWHDVEEKSVETDDDICVECSNL